MTNAEAVSLIINSLKLTTKDSRISRRYVLRVLRNITNTYVSQKFGERSLTKEYSLYSTVECFEFEKDDVVNCPLAEFRRCGILMKSKEKVPQLIYSRLGSSIREIRSIDDLSDFIIMDAKQYRINQKRKYSLKDKIEVYIAPNQHLYIPDKEIYSLNFDALTLYTEDLPTCKKDECKSAWDYEFICPSRLEEPVFKNALQTVATTYGAIIIDSNPNGIDKQQTQ